MTNYQESYEKMSLASVLFLNANANITTALPNFADYFGIVQTTNVQIRAAVVQQEADKSGETTAKKALRTALIKQSIDVSRRVVAYATNVNNPGLIALVNYTESDLKKSSDQKLTSSCQVIHDNANAHIAELELYGVHPRMLTSVQSSITSFNALIPKGRVDTTDSGDATQLLVSLFKILKVNWAKIDTLIEMVHNSEPNFYKEYIKVRKAIAMGTGSLPLKIQVTNAQTGAPEVNVTLTLTPVNGQLKLAAANGKGKDKGSIVKKTAKGGGSNFKGVPDSIYTVIATKSGFKDVTETVNVVNGEMTVLEIKMGKS